MSDSELDIFENSLLVRNAIADAFRGIGLGLIRRYRHNDPSIIDKFLTHLQEWQLAVVGVAKDSIPVFVNVEASQTLSDRDLEKAIGEDSNSKWRQAETKLCLSATVFLESLQSILPEDDEAKPDVAYMIERLNASRPGGKLAPRPLVLCSSQGLHS